MIINNSFREIKALYRSAVAHSNDGYLYVCGANTDGQIGTGIPYEESIHRLTETPFVNCKVKKIANATYNTFMLTENNVLYGCGSNEYGQLGLGYRGKRVSAFKEIASNVKDFFLGSDTLTVLKNDGTVWATGTFITTNLMGSNYIANGCFQCVAQDVKEFALSTNYSDFVGIIKNDNSLWATSTNKYGQLGLGHKNASEGFVKIADNVKKAYMYLSTIYLDNNNTLWGCGHNGYGQLGLGHKNNLSTITKITDNVEEFYVDNTCHKLLIKKYNDDNYYICGDNSLGSLGIGNTVSQSSFVKTNITNAKHICFRSPTALFYIDNNDVLWGCGFNEDGVLGIGSNSKIFNTFQKIYENVKEVDSIGGLLIVITNDNKILMSGGLYYCRPYIDDEIYHNTLSPIAFSEDASNVSTIYFSSSAYALIIATKDNKVYVSGMNNEFQLGIKNDQSVVEFTRLNINNIKKIVTDFSGYRTFVLKNDGTLLASGSNWYGDLGVNSYDVVYEFIQIADNVKDVFVNNFYSTFIVKNDGNVLAAGCNCCGELGIPSSYGDDQLTFASVPSLQGKAIKEIRGESSQTFVLLEDGTLLGAGAGKFLGINSTEFYENFIEINTNVKSLSSINVESYGYGIIKEDGSLWVCGTNDYGVLGLGSIKSAPTWTKVLDNVKEICTCYGINFALKDDNTLWATGFNTGGQLGIPTKNHVSTWTQTLDNVKEFYIYDNNTFAIKNDNTLWFTGHNNYDNAGDSTDTKIYEWTKINVPFDVSKIVSLSHTDETCYIVLEDGTAYFTGSNFFLESGAHPGLVSKFEVISEFTLYQVPDVFKDCDIMIDGELTHVITGNTGTNHEVILTEDSVYARGKNNYGQLGIGDLLDRYDYTKIEFNNPKEISCGNNHTVILNKDGEIFATGKNDKGQLGITNFENKNVFTKNETMNNVNHIAAIKDMTIVETKDNKMHKTNPETGDFE